MTSSLTPQPKVTPMGVKRDTPAERHQRMTALMMNGSRVVFGPLDNIPRTYFTHNMTAATRRRLSEFFNGVSTSYRVEVIVSQQLEPLYLYLIR